MSEATVLCSGEAVQGDDSGHDPCERVDEPARWARSATLDGILQADIVDERGTLTPQDLQGFVELGARLASLAGVAMPALGVLRTK